MPAGGCQTRKKHENETLQHQRQGGRSKVSDGIKMAKLVVGTAVGVALVSCKQQAQEAAAFFGLGEFIHRRARRRPKVFGKVCQTGSFCVRVNHTMQQAQCLRQQQDERKRSNRRQPPAWPTAASAVLYQAT